VLGVQMFALGLLGELVIFTHAGGSKDYKVDRVIQFSATDASQYATAPAVNRRIENPAAASPVAGG